MLPETKNLNKSFNEPPNAVGSETSGILLETINLNKSFGGLQAVQEVSFPVTEGTIKAVIGPNGAGKTTLFNLVTGCLKPDAGDIVFKEKVITRYREHTIAGLGISRTFQTTKLFKHMTVLENVMVGRHLKTSSGFFSGILNLPFCWKEEKAIIERSMAILNDLNLSAYAGEDAVSLPFGKQRVLEIARALATEPVLLLLDEPAAGLNIHETEELGELILRIRKSGITILIVEHDISLVMNISDEVLVLDRGKKLAEGPPSQIQKNREVINVYLGEDDA